MRYVRRTTHALPTASSRFLSDNTHTVRAIYMRCLETNLKAGRLTRPQRAHQLLHRRVAAAVARGTHLAQQPGRRQLWECCEPLTDVALERLDLGRTPLARTISGRLQAAIDVSTDRLAVGPNPSRNCQMLMPSQRRSRIITTSASVTNTALPRFLEEMLACGGATQSHAPQKR